MAGESSASRGNPPSTATGDDKSTRKRLQRTLTQSKMKLTRMFSIRRSKTVSLPSATPPTATTDEPPVAAGPAPTAEPEPEPIPEPIPELEREPVPAPPPEEVAVQPVKEVEESPKLAPVFRKPPSDTIPIKSPDDKREGPPPAISPADRARALFEKHGLAITPSEWPFSTIPQSERVHKEIKMRIHRTCHRCGTSYGPEKICVGCEHRRCKECPRIPLRKTVQEKGKQKEGTKPTGTKTTVKPVALGLPGVVTKAKKPVLTLPNPRGGPDLVRKSITQRVRRTCHRCSTKFGCEKICAKCKHTRCKKCPRDPLKKSKPPGYYDSRDPSDSEKEETYARQKKVYRKKRLRVHWICSNCDSTFEEHNRVCPGCSSNRDEVGIRHPPMRDRNPNTMIPSDSEIERIQQQLQATEL